VSSSVDTIAALVLGGIVVACALAMVSSRNVVHAAFWMLGSMLGTAGVYFLLSAGFLALVQIMVYAGAVAVLTIFVVMLTLRSREDAVRSRDFSWTAVALALTFAFSAVFAVWGFLPDGIEFPKVAPGIVEFSTSLFSVNGWMLPFELASLLLTVALVGAVWWSNGGGEE
jgi:NADH-quinone oxidoreductase subunit J